MSIASIACKNCGNDLWDVYTKTAECTNCGFERSYHSRKPSNEITTSQQKSIDRIKSFFDGSKFGNEPKELAKFEVKSTDYGTAWVSVETSDHVLTMRGGQFSIGPKGAIEVWSVYEISDDKEETAQHYARMVGGKVKAL